MAEAYEGLRPALLDPSGLHGAVTGRVLLRRLGMVAWAHARGATPVPPPAPRSLGAAAGGPEPSDVTSELVQLMAGLILTHHKESRAMPELKVTSAHLERDAYLYVRQSTARQVLENIESTQRQYALRERAVANGWPQERIHVIDGDLGKSAAPGTERGGFQELVSEVALGKAGMVLGLEASRLARSSVDWHRLLELCARAGTLILDEDGIYDPAAFNDRLLLGLKGELSQAELHVLKARMRGGVLNKARRGELEMGPPVGLVYRPDGVL